MANYNSPHNKADLAGQMFGKLTVIKEHDERGKGHSVLWECYCSCGNAETILVTTKNLRNGNTKSCGCYKKENFNKMLQRKKKNLTGKAFGRLTVIKESQKKDGKRIYWECVCNCGNHEIIHVSTKNLTSGTTQSCGCISREKIIHRNIQLLAKHNMSKTRLYNIWDTMRARCNRPSHKSYLDYGGRGIKVCEEWNSFMPFMEWALNNGYSEELTIDRKNVDGDYTPSNCRWVTIKEQINNTRVNRMVTLRGRTQTLSQWADEIGISSSTLRYRLEANWTEDDIFTEPNYKEKRKKI